MKWTTRFTEVFDIEYPIIQGGLAYLAYSDLASAVSNAGGLGQLTAMTCDSPDHLREEINHLFNKTKKPFAVNFAIGQHGRPFEEMLQAAIEAEVPAISVTGGNPAPVLQSLQGSGIKSLVLVSSVRQAQKAESLGADAVIVVGQEGGGHIGKGDLGTFVLTAAAAEAVSIPVIASGGITDGKGLMAALALGAEGIEMGTRFIATEECQRAHHLYKQALIDAKIDDTVVIKRSLGAPGRVLNNGFTSRILEIEQTEAGRGNYEVLKSHISGEANQAYIHHGEQEKGYAWAGQGAGRIKEVVSVDALFREIIKEAAEIRNKWA